MEELQKKIEKIEKRNLRVEADKNWERSWTRRVSIAILTYCFVSIFLYETEESAFLLKALIPVFGYILSTISLKVIRRLAHY